jgi:hypothetical protein
LATLSERLTKRFRNVPGVTAPDVIDWLTEAEEESGIVEGDVTSDNNALLYLAFSNGCKAIATDAARFFKYTDGEENVDKTNIFENYMRLSLDALAHYRYYKNGGGSRTVTTKRADDR